MKPFKIGDIIIFLNNYPVKNFYGIILKIYETENPSNEKIIEFYNLQDLSGRSYKYNQNTLFDYINKKYLKVYIK